MLAPVQNLEGVLRANASVEGEAGDGTGVVSVEVSCKHDSDITAGSSAHPLLAFKLACMASREKKQPLIDR